ncbi:ABC-2 family transporter protein [Candidatus Woesebacteria bacterium]|nr:ABC-2 family transporter protein [Candidatus Woesebacteria bacterium]
MNKYLTLLQLNWQNGLAYRTTVVMWRLRQFLETFMSLTVWVVIFESNPHAFQYTKDSMITYIFLVSFLQSVVIATYLNGLAQRVYSGEISNQLLKPVNIFGYFAIEEIADKLKNLSFLLIEMLILFLIFRPIVVIPEFGILLLFLTWSFLGVILNFFITLLFGAFGFYSPDTWGPRFLFYMIVNFTAGKLFPLDILPIALQKVLYFTPFPYLSFVQIQLFLQRLNTQEIIRHSMVFLFWVGVLGVLVTLLWKKGLRSYDSAGR